MSEPILSMKGEHDAVADIMKGIGMFLVVLGHTTHHEGLYEFAYTFHMPLFFFISGLLFKSRDGYVLKHLKSIGTPYLSFCLLSYVYWRFLELPFRKESNADVVGEFLNIFFPCDALGSYLFNVVLWYLPCLLVTCSMFYYLFRWTKGKRLYLLAFGAIVVIFDSFFQLSLPYYITQALCAIPYFMAGYFFKAFYPTLKSAVQANRWRGIGSCTIAFSLFAGVWLLPVGMNMKANLYYPNYVAALGVAVCGILGVVLLSSCLKSNRVIQWIGYNSLIIMCFHEPVKRIVIVLYSKKIRQDVSLVRESMLHSVVITCLVILCLVPFVYAIRKWFGFLIGKKRGIFV